MAESLACGNGSYAEKQKTGFKLGVNGFLFSLFSPILGTTFDGSFPFTLSPDKIINQVVHGKLGVPTL